MHVLLLDGDFAAVEPLPPDVVEVVLRDDDGQDGHAGVLGTASMLLVTMLLPSISQNHHHCSSDLQLETITEVHL